MLTAPHKACSFLASHRLCCSLQCKAELGGCCYLSTQQPSVQLCIQARIARCSRSSQLVTCYTMFGLNMQRPETQTSSLNIQYHYHRKLMALPPLNECSSPCCTWTFQLLMSSTYIFSPPLLMAMHSHLWAIHRLCTFSDRMHRP